MVKKFALIAPRGKYINEDFVNADDNEMLKQVQHDSNVGERSISKSNNVNSLPSCLPTLLSSKKIAFTLAEILITLSVVGIVAAITIPGLMTNINNKIKSHKVKVFQGKLKQGMDLLNTQNGIGPYYANTRDFVDALGKHMKIIAVCDSNNLNECMGYDKITLKSGETKVINDYYKTGTDFGLISDENNDWSSSTVGVIFGDGTPMLLNYNLKCPVSDPDSRNDNSTSCISGYYDINGTKSPNKRGEDILAFNGGWSKAFSPTPLTYNECMAVKDKLGIKECCPVEGTVASNGNRNYCSNQDYWAGAVKACGGVENMPTMKDLANLASQIYRVDNGDGEYSAVTIEPSKEYDGLLYNSNSSAAKAIGRTGARFGLFSNEEASSSSALNRIFYDSWTYLGSNHGHSRRYLSDLFAICSDKDN